MARYDISTIPTQLRRLRERKGIDRAVVAELCGMSDSTLRNIEKGEVTPRLINLVSLMDFYNCTFEDLCRNMDRGQR